MCAGRSADRAGCTQRPATVEQKPRRHTGQRRSGTRPVPRCRVLGRAEACQRRVYGLDRVGRLWARDAGNGERCESFETGQAVARAGGEGRSVSWPPPVVFEDSVIVAVSGALQAFDARSGEMRWSVELVPPAAGDDAKLSLDPRYKQVVVSIAGSVIAVEARTGTVRWRRELLRGAPTGYELAGPAALVTIDRDGDKLNVAVQRVSTGDVFVLARKSGEPVFPVDDPSESGQPRSRGIRPVSPQSLTVEQMFGLTVFDRDGCRRVFEGSRYEGLFTPPSEQGSIIYPAAVRGSGKAAAFDRNRNLLLVRSAAVASIAQKPADDDTHVHVTPFISSLGLPCVPPPWGLLTAIDMQTGEHRWQVPVGQYRYPGLSLPDATGWGAPEGSGPMITASGLVFVTSGQDAQLRVFDVRNGKALWKRSLSAPSLTTPITYQIDKRQFVLTITTEHSVAAFALPEQ
ncbi:MAG TPA: hypothetical protein ENK16_01930 [Chromatiales bacterium]|nr:hypothetical protein [Chromatiales bacterium]